MSELTTFFNVLVIFLNNMLKCKNCIIKKMLPERFRFIKNNAIYKKEVYSVHL